MHKFKVEVEILTSGDDCTDVLDRITRALKDGGGTRGSLDITPRITRVRNIEEVSK